MDDFFIGWQPSAPKPFAHRSKRFVQVLTVLAPLFAIVIVLSQQKFSSAVFEYGKTTDIEGVLYMHPVPRLRLDSGASLLLVGAGKHGPQQLLESLQAIAGLNPEGKRWRLKGQLIFHDGKGLLEVDADPAAALITRADDKQVRSPEILGEVTLCGEIADPKCFFGVMKPGEGKPHRSCAVRCISGGIPPVLKVENHQGESNYYLLKGTGGEDINQQVLQFIADGVTVHGRLELDDDWYVLKIDPGNDILRERPYWIGKEEMMCRNR